MNFKKYTELANKTLAPSPETYNHMTALHMVMGMTTEVGELVDVFKKHMAYGKPIDWVNVEEELGDLMWYIANFCNEYNIDMDAVLHKNISKLAERYPDEEFTSYSAINRDTDAEREILEQ